MALTLPKEIVVERLTDRIKALKEVREKIEKLVADETTKRKVASLSLAKKVAETIVEHLGKPTSLDTLQTCDISKPSYTEKVNISFQLTPPSPLAEALKKLFESRRHEQNPTVELQGEEFMSTAVVDLQLKKVRKALEILQDVNSKSVPLNSAKLLGFNLETIL